MILYVLQWNDSTWTWTFSSHVAIKASAARFDLTYVDASYYPYDAIFK